MEGSENILFQTRPVGEESFLSRFSSRAPLLVFLNISHNGGAQSKKKWNRPFYHSSVIPSFLHESQNQFYFLRTMYVIQKATVEKNSERMSMIIDINISITVRLNTVAFSDRKENALKQ